MHLTTDDITVLEVIVLVCLTVLVGSGLLGLIEGMLRAYRDLRQLPTARERYESVRDTLNFSIEQVVSEDSEPHLDDEASWFIQTALYNLRRARKGRFAHQSTAN